MMVRFPRIKKRMDVVIILEVAFGGFNKSLDITDNEDK